MCLYTLPDSKPAAPHTIVYQPASLSTLETGTPPRQRSATKRNATRRKKHNILIHTASTRARATTRAFILSKLSPPYFTSASTCMHPSPSSPVTPPHQGSPLSFPSPTPTSCLVAPSRPHAMFSAIDSENRTGPRDTRPSFCLNHWMFRSCGQENKIKTVGPAMVGGNVKPKGETKSTENNFVQG